MAAFRFSPPRGGKGFFRGIPRQDRPGRRRPKPGRDVFLGNTPVAGCEGKFIADRFSEELLFGVLEHQAHLPADFPEARAFFLHFKSIDEDLPLHGRRMPFRCWARVDLPLPVWPTTENHVPAGNSKEMSPEGAGFEGGSRVIGVAEAGYCY